MATAHINAAPGDFAPDVLLPGDPNRAANIAERFFDEPRLVTDVRGIVGYTGSVAGRPVSVLASGMGIPSLSIYATELAREFGVRRIVRVGTAGGLLEEVNVGDVVIAAIAHTDSGLTNLHRDGIALSYGAHPALLRAAMGQADRSDSGVHVGAVFSTDFFYSPRERFLEPLREVGTLAVEMEAAGLYAVGMRERVETLTIATIADHTLRGESLSSQERETVFEAAVTIALGAFCG